MSGTPPTGPGPAPLAATGRPDDPAWYTRRLELALYVLAGASYIGFGLFHKWLLNWVIGPLWLVAWIWFVPAGIDRLRGRGGR